MVIFEGDPSGSLNKKGMAVISDWNYSVWARNPSEIPQFLVSVYGDMPTMTNIGMHKSHIEY